MLFFEFKITVSDVKDDSEKSVRERREFAEFINSNVAMLNSSQKYNVRFYVCEFKDNEINLAAVIGSKNNDDLGALARDFVQKLGFVVKELDYEEIVCSKFARLIHKADQKSFIDDDEDILQAAHLGSYRTCISNRFEEALIDTERTKEKIVADSSNLSVACDLTGEISRIYEGNVKKFISHPVHYIFIIDDDETAERTMQCLTSALYSMGRLKSRRIAMLKASKHRIGMMEEEYGHPVLDIDIVRDIYESIPGGTIVLKPGRLDYESDTTIQDEASIESLAEQISLHKRDCLSILIFSKAERKDVQNLKNRLADIRFVQIEERMLSYEKSVDVLLGKAGDNEFDDTESLLSKIDRDSSYYMSELNSIFEEWLDNTAVMDRFPQYADIKTGVPVIHKPVGSAYDKLQSLIGLENVKKIINQTIHFNSFQRLCEDHRLSSDKPSRHMVFMGNPGTAKTTVARLFARIMKDNGILPRGSLVEVGRQDLVGKYVGWTAQLVEKAFDKARGSVLFIDEAYSLCEGKEGLYGDEAINTIVQLMENRRDDTIVIFAGYPDKMDAFLDRNPGLRSRIAFNVHFEDYSEDNLVDIFKLMVAENKLNIADGVEEKVRSIVSKALDMKHFGNGRFVRNVFERARMAQAERVMSISAECITDYDLTTLIEEDFIISEEMVQTNNSRRIGFLAS